MPGTIWGKKEYVGPSAGLVKRHYVEARLAALYRRDKGLEQRIADTLRQHQKFQHLKLKGDAWLPVYHEITKNLQKAHLTINFDASRWFGTENRFDSYTQLYERSGRNQSGHGQLMGNTQNPVLTRTQADDRVTFDNPVRPGSSRPPQRGLMPGRQGIDRVREQMEFRAAGKERKIVVDPGDSTKDQVFADSTNEHFNPKTKQIFAALNYGRRLLGSNIDYGRSHMVLAPKFKINAIYFGGDTFYHKDASRQTAYGVLGALVALVDPILLGAILESCYFGATLGDNKSPNLMVEAHIFDELTFTGNITAIFLDAKAYSPEHVNAKKFAARHGAKLVLVSA